MDYSEFLRTAEDFVFAEDQPEKADIIFVPGNGFPQMAERAAQLYKEGSLYSAQRKIQHYPGEICGSAVSPGNL